jgi:hypothetical protein
MFENIFYLGHSLVAVFEFPMQIPPSKTLLTPVQCKSLWRQFKMETEYSVSQAISAQVQCFPFKRDLEGSFDTTDNGKSIATKFNNNLNPMTFLLSRYYIFETCS